MRTLTIAAIQTTPVAFDTAASWERFQAQVRAVREPSHASISSLCRN